jgi:hypothetical protein
MIRRMLKLAVDAAKVEAKRRLGREEPEPAQSPSAVEPSPVAEEAPTPVTAAPVKESPWVSGNYHQMVLKSASCPECEQPKKVGAYRCPSCIERKRSEAGLG